MTAEENTAGRRYTEPTVSREFAYFESQPLPTEQQIRDALAKRGLIAPFDLPESERKGKYFLVPMVQPPGYGYWAEREAEWDDMNHIWVTAGEEAYWDSEVRGVREYSEPSPLHDTLEEYRG